MSKKHEPRDWAAIRHAYEHGDGSLAQIRARFGVTKGSMEYRARRDRWIPRQATQANSRSALLARMFKVLDGQVQKLERRADDLLSDKEATQLGEMARAMEKMVAIEAADATKGDPVVKKDMRDIRDKLAKRIDEFKRR